nr:ROK family protein [Pseudolysinimonas kribbensis]
MVDALAASSGLSVVRENDAACAAIGQFWVGRLSAAQSFATLYMATGFGCGIVEHGALARGASSNVGEIGHMVVEVDGPPCWCGSRGCLEMLAAPRRVISSLWPIRRWPPDSSCQGPRPTSDATSRPSDAPPRRATPPARP